MLFSLAEFLRQPRELLVSQRSSSSAGQRDVQSSDGDLRDQASSQKLEGERDAPAEASATPRKAFRHHPALLLASPLARDQRPSMQASEEAGRGSLHHAVEGLEEETGVQCPGVNHAYSSRALSMARLSSQPQQAQEDAPSAGYPTGKGQDLQQQQNLHRFWEERHSSRASLEPTSSQHKRLPSIVGMADSPHGCPSEPQQCPVDESGTATPTKFLRPSGACPDGRDNTVNAHIQSTWESPTRGGLLGILGRERRASEGRQQQIDALKCELAEVYPCIQIALHLPRQNISGYIDDVTIKYGRTTCLMLSIVEPTWHRLCRSACLFRFQPSRCLMDMRLRCRFKLQAQLQPMKPGWRCCVGAQSAVLWRQPLSVAVTSILMGVVTAVLCVWSYILESLRHMRPTAHVLLARLQLCGQAMCS